MRGANRDERGAGVASLEACEGAASRRPGLESTVVKWRLCSRCNAAFDRLAFRMAWFPRQPRFRLDDLCAISPPPARSTTR